MDADRLINTVIRKRYRIVKFLGSGSFGDTYLAEDLDLPGNPKCVVKQLKPKASEPEVMLVARRLFESEAEALYRLGNLSHQIPKIFAHFEENGEFYLVQEFIDGHNLAAEIIPDHRWSEAKVAQLLQQILEILVVVHQHNIIHRDIKPQNLMRRRDDGKIVLIDFGAVKEIKTLAANTQGQVTSTIAIGSNGYMPNEQANFKPKLCSDIYAVGVIGIQALTGKLPRDFSEDPATGEIIWQNEVNVSDKLANVLTKMVRYNFSQRYQTASEALQALSSLSPALSKSTTSWTLPSRKKVLFATGIGAGILVMLVLAPLVLLRTKTTERFTQLPCEAELSSLSLPPLPSTPDKETNNTKYYGFKNSTIGKNSTTGKGTVILPNQDRYDGELKNGLFMGCGKYRYTNGTIYIGQFENGKFHGRGTYIFENGDRYIGQFENNNSKGIGTWICKNGNKRKGEYNLDNKICK